jgi:hypothetical protein
MFVLFAILSVRGQFRGQLEVNREAITRYARVKGLLLKIELEAEIVAGVRNRPSQIIARNCGAMPERRVSAVCCPSDLWGLTTMPWFCPRLTIA